MTLLNIMNWKFKFAIFMCSMVFISFSKGQNTKTSSGQALNQIPAFNINFPRKDVKVEKTEDFDYSLGVKVTNWLLQGEDQNGPFMFFVAHNVMPEKLKILITKEPKTLQVAFQAMLTSSATKLGGTDFKFTNIRYKSFDGMESICKVFDGDGFIKSRVYNIEDNLFMISAGGQNISRDSVDRFLNSFEIKK